jgi:translation initiation factor 1
MGLSEGGHVTTASGKRSGGDGWGLVERCPTCGRERGDCLCTARERESLPPSKQRPRLRLEKRRGRPVTIITHLHLSEADLKSLGGKLRARLGTGGSARDGVIELQGDHRQTLPNLLGDLGFRI